MKPKPYVGITGFRLRGDLAFTDSDLDGFARISYVPAFGIIVSDKRLEQPSKDGKTSPAFQGLPCLLELMPENVLPTIHYFTSNPQNLGEELNRLLGEGVYSRGGRTVQLNTKNLPDIKQLSALQEDYSKLEFILSLSKEILSDHNPQELAKRVREYDGIVSYVLIDPSWGKGLEVDLNQYAELIIVLDEALPNMRVGVAGGFDADNVEDRVLKLAEKVKIPFSIDAQSGLRTDNELDIVKAKLYLAKSRIAILESQKYFEKSKGLMPGTPKGLGLVSARREDERDSNLEDHHDTYGIESPFPK